MGRDDTAVKKEKGMPLDKPLNEADARVAAEAAARGDAGTLLTSHPEALGGGAGVRAGTYRTFDELDALMAEEVGSGRYDAVVHAAAVSDYHVAGVFAGRD